MRVHGSPLNERTVVRHNAVGDCQAKKDCDEDIVDCGSTKPSSSPHCKYLLENSERFVLYLRGVNLSLNKL